LTGAGHLPATAAPAAGRWLAAAGPGADGNWPPAPPALGGIRPRRTGAPRSRLSDRRAGRDSL